MTKGIVSIERLVKSYNGINVVNKINFEIYPGEVFALLGPNGAGKTTTLECIEGIRKPDSGIISISGHNPQSEFQKIRNVLGVQLQASALPDIITVEEAMKMFCLYFGMNTRYDLLEKFDLTSKYKTQFASLSTGQQRKVALAIALAHNPSVLILDEPTAGLDVNTRVELHGLIREERKKGTAILLASHDMAEVEGLADKVAILLNGKIVSSGTPHEIINAGDKQVKIHVKSLNDSIMQLNLKANKIEEKEGYRVYYTEDIEGTVHSVLAHIKSNNDKLIDLRIERPSLEERFMDITKTRG